MAHLCPAPWTLTGGLLVFGGLQFFLLLIICSAWLKNCKPSPLLVIENGFSDEMLESGYSLLFLFLLQMSSLSLWGPGNLLIHLLSLHRCHAANHCGTRKFFTLLLPEEILSANWMEGSLRQKLGSRTSKCFKLRFSSVASTKNHFSFCQSPACHSSDIF